MCAEAVDADAFRARLAEQLGGIRALALSVDEVLSTVREPAAESVAMGEIAAEQNYRSRSAWEAPVADTHSFAVATLRASSDYVRGFPELFNADHPPLYAHLPLARAALEAAGASFWLSELGIGPLDPMKRGLCELLYSANEVADLDVSANASQSAVGRRRAELQLERQQQPQQADHRRHQAATNIRVDRAARRLIA